MPSWSHVLDRDTIVTPHGSGVFHMRKVLDWIFTIPFLVTFGLTLAIFEPIARIARWFGLRPMEITMGVMQRVLLFAFRLGGTRLLVERSPQVLPRTGYIIVSNHQSLFDIPIFGGLLFSNYPKYVAKRELGRWLPSISFNLAHGGNAVIDRNDPIQARNAIRELGEAAESRNVAVVIFPEGTRSRDGRLKTFRAGGLTELLAAAPSLQVVPTAIDGAWELLRYKLFPIPFGTTVRVRFSEPLDRVAGEDPKELLGRARAVIEGTLAEWRDGSE
ncbi:MAG: lysophospholipid acyltransferase family protein [Actinomycetota bacterium]|nr:lysophospholipid acyltransferase family protein [Actinomycetota bacterium]